MSVIKSSDCFHLRETTVSHSNSKVFHYCLNNRLFIWVKLQIRVCIYTGSTWHSSSLVPVCGQLNMWQCKGRGGWASGFFVELLCVQTGRRHTLLTQSWTDTIVPETLCSAALTKTDPDTLKHDATTGSSPQNKSSDIYTGRKWRQGTSNRDVLMKTNQPELQLINN